MVHGDGCASHGACRTAACQHWMQPSRCRKDIAAAIVPDATASAQASGVRCSAGIANFANLARWALASRTEVLFYIDHEFEVNIAAAVDFSPLTAANLPQGDPASPGSNRTCLPDARLRLFQPLLQLSFLPQFSAGREHRTRNWYERDHSLASDASKPFEAGRLHELRERAEGTGSGLINTPAHALVVRCKSAGLIGCVFCITLLPICKPASIIHNSISILGRIELLRKGGDPLFALSVYIVRDWWQRCCAIRRCGSTLNFPSLTQHEPRTHEADRRHEREHQLNG